MGQDRAKCQRYANPFETLPAPHLDPSARRDRDPEGRGGACSSNTRDIEPRGAERDSLGAGAKVRGHGHLSCVCAGKWSFAIP